MAWETPTGVVDGVNTVFTTAGVISNEILLVDRLVQTPTLDYTISASTITFTAGAIPPPGAVIRIQYTALVPNIGVSATAAVTFDYSATGITSRIRDLAYAGTSNRDWDDPKLLRLINAEILEYLVPFIMKARKNHFDTFKDIPLAASQLLYWLPSDATALKVRAMILVDASGNPYAGLQERDLEDVIGFGASFLNGSLPAGIPAVYSFQGNQITLFPTPSGSPTLSLRIHYVRRPSTLVANASCIQVTGFPGGAAAGFFRLGFSGTAPAGIVTGSTVDLVQQIPGFDLLYSGVVNAISAGTYVECTGTQPVTAQLNNWLCVSGTAPVVTGSIPEMVIGCLVKKCVLEVLSGKSDDAAFKRTQSLLAMDEGRAHQFLNRRNSGDRPKAGIGSLFKFKRSWGGVY